MKAVCAVSGGMDSATCLWNCVDKYGPENVLGVSVFYGQRHEIELTKAKEECEKLNVKHIEANLTSVFQFNKNVSALLQGSKEEIVQDKTYAELMDEKIAKGEVPISDEYIPNRNSIIANILAAIGMQFFKNEEITIVMGVHSDDNLIREGSDISAYPDCSPEWSAAVSKELEIGTAGLVRLETPLVYKTKTGVAQFGMENGMTKEDFNHTWSCYKGGDKQCGKCPTCLAEGTKIWMGNGTLKAIEDIQVGDEVWSMGEDFKMTLTKVTEVLDQGEKECFSVLNNLTLTKDHLVYSPSRNHRKSGYYELKDLNEEDKVLFFDPSYATENTEVYRLGYLRGFVEGDGHIGDRSIFTCQKSKDILLEFWSLYNEVIGPSDTEVKYDEKRDIYIGDGGYTKTFVEKTAIQYTEEYAKGYIAGMMIADGCAAYNKANNSFGYVLGQSASANPEKCTTIEKMLDVLDIGYIKWQSRCGGFKEEGSLMNYYKISKPWRMPLVYGGSKKQDMLNKCSTYGSLRMMPKRGIGMKNQAGVKHVYDINTETHSFFADGILVHNCIDRIRALINVGIYREVKDLTDNYQLTETEAEKLLNPDK